MTSVRKRTCATLRCPNIFPKADGSYCPTCKAQREAERGSSRQRGYDTEHDREAAAAKLLAIGTRCPRCRELMLEGQALDFGHSRDRASNPGSRADRVEHAACNHAAGGRAGAAYRE